MTNQDGKFITRSERIAKQAKEAKVNGKFKGAKKVVTLSAVGALFLGSAGASLLAIFNDEPLDEIYNNVKQYVEDVTANEADLNQQIADLEADKVALNETIAGHEETIAGHVATIAQKDAKIEELNQQIANLESAGDADDATILDLQNQIQTLQGEKEALEAQVTQLTNEKADMQTQLDAKDARIAELEGRVEEQQTQIDELVNEINRANVKTEQTKNQVNELLGMGANPDVNSPQDPEADPDVPAEEGEEANAGGSGEQVETVTGAMLKETYEANATSYSGTMQQTINEGSAYTYKNHLIVNHEGVAYVVNKSGEIVAQQELTENSNGKKSVKIKVAYASGPMTATDGGNGATIYTIQ